MKQITFGDKELDIKFTMGVLANAAMTKTEFTEVIDAGGDKLFEALKWMVYYAIPKPSRPADIKDVGFDKEDFYEMKDHSMILLEAYAEFLPKKMGDALLASINKAVDAQETILDEAISEVSEKN